MYNHKYADLYCSAFLGSIADTLNLSVIDLSDDHFRPPNQGTLYCPLVYGHLLPCKHSSCMYTSYHSGLPNPICPGALPHKTRKASGLGGKPYLEPEIKPHSIYYLAETGSEVRMLVE
jgi:hypothetical protein